MSWDQKKFALPSPFFLRRQLSSLHKLPHQLPLNPNSQQGAKLIRADRRSSPPSSSLSVLTQRTIPTRRGGRVTKKHTSTFPLPLKKGRRKKPEIVTLSLLLRPVAPLCQRRRRRRRAGGDVCCLVGLIFLLLPHRAPPDMATKKRRSSFLSFLVT